MTNCKKLKILCLEDNESDAIIIRELLQREDLIFLFDRVSLEKEFTEKLKSGYYDIILSDYNLPGFSGIAALLVSKRILPEVPFICVSGTIGEDLAVELMQLGASDYIKKDNLNKLPVSIHRALQQANERKARIEAEVSLRESEARFRDILMSSYDWVWEIDQEWKYCYSSETIEHILGYSVNEIIGKSPFDFMPHDEVEKTGQTFSKIAESCGIIKDLENWNIHKNGQRVCLLTNGFPVFDQGGNLKGYRGVDKDITKSKILNLELIVAKEKAEASDRLKTAFLNNISHEVRTPLNGIVGFAEYLLTPDISNEDKIVSFEILNQSSERLLSTITNYMDISLLVSGNLMAEASPVNITNLIGEMHKKFLPKAEIKNLKLITDLTANTLSTFNLDGILLEKTLSHLLDNAVKFTSEGSITLGFHYNGAETEFFVKDTGIGITPIAQESIFHIFMQEETSSTREYEGSGLGLSIAKGFIELMGGKIWLESEKDKGSSFYFTVPASNETYQVTVSEKDEKKLMTNESPVILIVEDDPSNSEYFRMIMEINSFRYLIASNGQEAIDTCRNHPEISLILMDIKMPVMDGLVATRKIREFRKDLSIIGVSAYAMTGDMERALAAGCSDYITKPVRADFILSVIKNHLGMTD